jgi:MgtC family
MQIWLAGPLLGGTVQGSRHLIELFAAFGLTTLIGLERTIQGKVAGLRTQTIVGTSAALIMLTSKYGFGDVMRRRLSWTRPGLPPKSFQASAFWERGSSSLDAVRCMGSPLRQRCGNRPRSAWPPAPAYCCWPSLS